MVLELLELTVRSACMSPSDTSPRCRPLRAALAAGRAQQGGPSEEVRLIPTMGQKPRQPGEPGNLGPTLTINAGQGDGVVGGADEPAVSNSGSGEGIQTSDGIYWVSPACPSVPGLCGLTLHGVQGSKLGQDSPQEHALLECQGLPASGPGPGTAAHLPLLCQQREWVRGQALELADRVRVTALSLSFLRACLRVTEWG